MMKKRLFMMKPRALFLRYVAHLFATGRLLRVAAHQMGGFEFGDY